MTLRTKRIFLVVVFAVIASGVTKVATYEWRSSAEAEYRVAEHNLGYDEPIPEHTFWQKAYGKSFVDRAKWEYRRVRHLSDNLPEYGRTVVMLQLSKLVDQVLVWVVIFVFLLMVLFWAVGKLFNNWVDGSLISNKSIETRMLDNGDIVIHIDHANQGVVK